MKKIACLLVLLSAQTGFCQVTKNLGDFHKVTSFDQIDVTLVPSDQTKIILNGKDSEAVELVNNNGELKVRMPLNKLLKGDNVSATVFYKELTAVEANEGSRIAGETPLKSAKFDLIAKEGSEIKLTLEVQKLTAKASGGSKVFLEGTADKQDLLVNSGANFDAEKLHTEQTAITVNAGGDSKVYATELVEAKIRAGGKILVYGKPKQLNQKTIAGGSIEQAE